jgi:hypothetical protein
MGGETMRALTPDEKLVTVMVYTRNMLVRGDLIARESMRVSIWLRTQGVPNYIHLMNAQSLVFGGGTPRSLSYSEIYIPVEEVICFHMAPPAADPLDYDTSETNRAIASVTALVGTFTIKAKIRYSSQIELGASLDVMRTSWLSLYEAEITNPYIPQFNVQVPMLLVSAKTVSFGI